MSDSFHPTAESSWLGADYGWETTNDASDGTRQGFTHGWDLARAIGYPADLDPILAAELLSHARLATTDAYRGRDGQAPFGPEVQAPAGAGPADQLAAFLGRPA